MIKCNHESIAKLRDWQKTVTSTIAMNQAKTISTALQYQREKYKKIHSVVIDIQPK